jgi:hypothetical protein
VFKQIATPPRFQRLVQAKARQAVNPAPPTTQFGAPVAQPKAAPALGRAVTPPPTKFGTGVGQPKAAPSATPHRCTAADQVWSRR